MSSRREEKRPKLDQKRPKLDQKKANRVPDVWGLHEKDEVFQTRDFKRSFATFEAYHASVNTIMLSDFKLNYVKVPLIPARPKEWMIQQFSRAIRIQDDTSLADALQFKFLLYIASSMSSETTKKLTSDVREHLFQLNTTSMAKNESRYVDSYDDSLIHTYVDFTSVGQGFGDRGILPSRHYLDNCLNVQTCCHFSLLVDATIPALKATSFMYHMLATQDSTGIHDAHLKLSCKTFDMSPSIIQSLLGKAWSPFSQRRLLCNVVSKPHVDSGNAKHSLNALTFFGKATTWLVLMVQDQPYAFKASPGASILFPASLLEHFVCDWDDSERYVLTSWTSNQLGYKSMVPKQKN